MLKNKNRKVRNFLINPKYQLKYLFWVSITGLTLVAINAAVFYIFIKENYLLLVDMSPMEDEVKLLMYRELKQILWILGGFSAFFLLILCIFGVIISHRTAGPMFHFKRIFKEVRSGRLQSRIRLRPKDDFRDVADECNSMIEYLVSLSQKPKS
jgi:hypothetical protein